MTGAAPKAASVHPTGSNHVQLVRTGETYQLLVNGESIIAQRMPEHREFRSIVVGLGAHDWNPPSAARLFAIDLQAVNEVKGDRLPSTETSAAPPRLGIFAKDAAEHFKRPAGVEIEKLDQDAPAARAGLRPGDVLTHADGKRITRVWQLDEIRARLVRAHPMSIRFYRPPVHDHVAGRVSPGGEMTAEISL